MNRVARLVVSFALPLLLLAYFICSLAYSIGCGLLGRSYAALSTYQTYAVTMLPFLLGGLVVGRLSGVFGVVGVVGFAGVSGVVGVVGVVGVLGVFGVLGVLGVLTSSA
jgi:hypothetical protein